MQTLWLTVQGREGSLKRNVWVVYVTGAETVYDCVLWGTVFLRLLGNCCLVCQAFFSGLGTCESEMGVKEREEKGDIMRAFQKPEVGGGKNLIPETWRQGCSNPPWYSLPTTGAPPYPTETVVSNVQGFFPTTQKERVKWLYLRVWTWRRCHCHHNGNPTSSHRRRIVVDKSN